MKNLRLKLHLSEMVVFKDILQNKLGDFLSLCKSHMVKNIYAFGSAITDDFNEKTGDTDLVIEINQKDPILRGESLLIIWEKLEEYFQRKVDLLTLNSIKNPILKQNIEATKVLIYDGKKQEILH